VDIDIEEERPIMHQGYAGYGGPWAIHQSLRWISEIFPQLKIDISGSGGVSGSGDIIKYLLAGATTVQTVTAILLNGYGIIEEFIGGLKEYMDRKSYQGIEDFRGKLSSRIKGTYEIKRDHYLKAEINDNLIPPCQAGCPAGIDIQGYVALISQGKFGEAFDLIREKVPFPLVLSRICPRPCEEKCIRGKVDEPVAINALKRFVADRQMEKSVESNLSVPNPPLPTDNSQLKVAIIGAGPIGLTCAYELAKLGYKVVVFESSSKAGGMLVLGIPGYRLPKGLVEKEIKEIEEQGVEIKLNTTVGKDLTWGDLKEMGYKAIFIATGAHKSKRLDIPGENLLGVMDGLSFLKRVNLDKQVEVGKRVAIIGGGNTAVDAARSSIRLGAKEVYLIYRRTKEEMPAIPEEVERAEEEGVKILYLTLPREITGKNGRVNGLKCVPLVLDEIDAEGRRKPLPISASEFLLKIDTLIVAMGQSPDLSFLDEERELKIGEDNSIVVNPITYATSQPGIFAAGDVVKGSSSVIEAIAAGKRVAVSMHRYLQGESLREDHQIDEVIVSANKVLKEKGFVEQKKRVEISTLPIERRRSTPREIERVLEEKEAIQEAKRCLACSCGLGCGICEKVCIYSAIERVGGRYGIDAERCDGCGLCVEVCPKENIKMVRA
ncbi:FAD-dependent oxidoreductase, partial [Candidatus Aerophobetes bacterium]|nr:FAD-dependent oxidoreductase [Candidatus Aerophobetes bacterium]